MREGKLEQAVAAPYLIIDGRRMLPDYMSLVHFVFPNVSISGGHGDTLMLSRLFPGPTVRESTTVQHQYFRVPVEGEMVEKAEEKRRTSISWVCRVSLLLLKQVFRYGLGNAERRLDGGQKEEPGQQCHRAGLPRPRREAAKAGVGL